MSDYVRFEQKGHVAIVTINRPDRMNALGHEVRTGLVEAFLKIRTEPSIKVAVITGAGDKAFSAGADLKEHNEIFQKKSHRVGPDYGALDEPPHSSHLAIETYKPLIAAVNGYALKKILEN
jgi:enoyl-CoA hydratase/carnithine racemase